MNEPRWIQPPRQRPRLTRRRHPSGLTVVFLALALGNAGAIAAVARYDPGDQWAAILMLAANALGWAAVAAQRRLPLPGAPRREVNRARHLDMTLSDKTPPPGEPDD